MKLSNLDRRTRYTLRVIRAAMFELMESKPLEKITVTDICQLADINRGTFYKYYRDVYDLFEKTGNDFIEEIHALFLESDASSSDMPRFFASIFQILSENKDLVQIAKNREFTERFTQKLLVFVLPHIHQLVTHSHPSISQEEATLLTEYIMGGCTRVVAAWIRDDMKIPAEQMERYITKFITQAPSGGI